MERRLTDSASNLLALSPVSFPVGQTTKKACRNERQALDSFGGQGRNRTIDTRIFSPILFNKTIKY